MALKCKTENCKGKLLFEGGTRVGRTDLEIYQCTDCKKYFSFDLRKGKLEEWKNK